VLHGRRRSADDVWVKATGSTSISVSGSDLESIERHLSSGERVQWAGRPDPSTHVNRGDAFLIPFSIMWGGFAIFWEASSIAGGAPILFDLFGVPFVAIGLYFMVGRFAYKANRKRRTLYAVTNRRVMVIVHGRRGEAVDAANLRTLPSVSTTVGADCSGSVEFGASSPRARPYGNSGMELFTRGQGSGALVSFFDIDDPQGVADLVERLRDSD
jgi:hypothetical protein